VLLHCAILVFAKDASTSPDCRGHVPPSLSDISSTPYSTLPSPILSVSAPPRILIIVRKSSEVIGVSANDEKGTGSFWGLYPAAEHDSIKSVRNANAQFTSLADLLLSVRPTVAAGAEGGRHARAAWVPRDHRHRSVSIVRLDRHRHLDSNRC
jgi:hypothetical protein